MKCKKSGFTLVELLTVVGIIAILIGLLVPALSMVRKVAKETQQKAQLTTLDMALLAFKNDYGDYPPSDWPDLRNLLPVVDYCGAQKLAEALLGWDLLGFHPDTDWRADGYDENGGWLTYDPDKDRDINGDLIADTLEERRGCYLELATANAFRLGVVDQFKDGLFKDTDPLEPDTFVICDVFGVRRMTLASGETVKAGTPILYYKANPSSKNITVDDLRYRIYNARDNRPLMDLGKLTVDGSLSSLEKDKHPLGYLPDQDFPVFYSDYYNYGGVIGYGIKDPKASSASGIPWPYRPDTYILISAGADGLYGTRDDIRNFGN